MHSPVPERHTLDNGIQVLAESMPGAQSVVVMFRFPFGAQEDPIDRLGMASVAEDTLFKGTPDKDARAVFDTFDALGVRRGSAASVEYTEFQAQLLPRHLEETLRLYAEVFRNASFPDDQVDVSKALALEELKRLEDNPAQQVMYKTYQAGLGDPMGRLPLGEMGTVATIAPPDVRTFWTKFCGPEHLIISMAGGLDAQQMFDAVEAAFGDWPMDGREAGQVHPVSVASRYVHQSKQSQQAHIGMLFGSVPRGHELYYSGQLTIAVLSGSGSSRLFTEVREKRGLAYSVAAFYRARRGGGVMGLYAGTTADRADETLAVCMQELQRVGKDVTQEELDRARTVLKGRLFTTGDLPEGRAGSLLEDMFLDGHVRSVEQIAQGVDSVRLEQISAYLEAFPLEPYTLVTLGPRTLKEE